MDTIVITFENGMKKEYKKGVKLKEVIDDTKEYHKFDIIAGKFKNHLISYNDSLIKSGKLELYDITTKIGNDIYEKGLIYLFISAVYDVISKDVNINIKHSIDKGIFCEINKPLTEEDLSLIKQNMQEKIKLEVPFVKIETSRLEAINYFKSIKRYDKAKTLFYNTNGFITLYKFNGLYNYVIGELPNDTSVLKYFDLTLILNVGVVVRYPGIRDDGKVVKYTHHEKLFNALDEYASFGKILNVNNVGDLNEYITNGNSGELINLSEMLQDYKLLNIASTISVNSDIKLILISGPSSSGKTTMSNKLSLYLKTLGLNPIRISLDDYFLNREDTPLDEFGKPDYESISCIDIDLFREQMSKLQNGEKVNTPIFDFVEGKKTFKRTIQMQANDVLIIEGLHALNNELTKSIPKRAKFKIYISPLSYLNVDNDNRIHMTDIRLLRRIVRDNRTRGYSPSVTLANWKDVRKGEDKYVFPYQDDADVIFNSFLVYELSVLKTYVEPLLFSVKEDDNEYLTALRLIHLLRFVVPLPSDDIPKVSLLREFIGGSFFEK